MKYLVVINFIVACALNGDFSMVWEEEEEDWFAG